MSKKEEGTRLLVIVLNIYFLIHQYIVDLSFKKN